MKPPMKKSMSDGDVNDFAWKKLMGDLDGIEAAGMFDEENPMEHPHEGVKEMNGVSIEIKPMMAGEQTKEAPEIMDEDEEKDELGKLGL